MSLEDGLVELEELEWELGGLKLQMDQSGDDGLDDGAEVEGEDEDGAGDGGPSIGQRLAPRDITLNVQVPNIASGELEAEEVFAQALNEIRKVTSPLPDRHATRLLRWRRQGEVAKRIAVQPAVGKVIVVPGDINALVHSYAIVQIRLTAPDPVILSDDLHTVTMSAGVDTTITNAGSFTAKLPMAWELSASGPVGIRHDNYPNEIVKFPAGPVTVTRSRGVYGPANTYGVVYGDSGSLFPAWPLLRPGDNVLRSDATCTFSWRDTW